MRQNSGAWLLMAFVIAAAVAYAQNAKGETYLYAGAWSKHFGDKEYNEEHKLIAIEHENVMAGYFVNSYSEDSFALAYNFRHSYGDLDAGVMAGAVFGYRHCLKGWADRNRRTCPMLAPYVSLDAGPVNPTVLLLGNAVAISVRIGL